MLLRRVIGDALRARRQAQHRTLREVSTAANVSLGYLSEIERGQKEASSELLSAICDALGAALSEVLREVSDTLALAEEMSGVLVPLPEGMPERIPQPQRERRVPVSVPAAADEAAADPVETAPAASASAAAQGAGPARESRVRDANVSVAVHREGPLKTTLRAIRHRDIVRAA